ncbi:ankyrin repeat-containing domain protein [Colletotrichum cereale]|nr:ankyrin repeat-containing domain protein [Colletotrichum cereale]
MLSKLSRQFRNWSTDASLIYSIVRRYQSDIFGASALELAARSGDLAGCDLLLELGAPINLHGVRGQTALQAASSEGELLMVQFLLDQGADATVPAYEDGGYTALQAAVLNGHERIAKCLLDAKADIRAPPAKRNGKTIVEAFAHYEDKTVSKFRKWLSQGAPINRLDGDDGNVLHLLIEDNTSSAHACLEIALQAGARIEDRDQFSRGQKTPLQVAAEVGDLDSVRLLLKYGANVNAFAGDDFGRTALQAAVCRQNFADLPAMVELLLSLGADVNAPPARKGGITALQGAAISGDISMVKRLVELEADVNAAPAVEEGRTAIEGAAEHGRLDMVRFLISVGATGNPERGFDRAIELAVSENHSLIADFLRDQQDLSAGFGMGMDDMFGGDFFSQVPCQGFVFSEENLGNFTF